MLAFIILNFFRQSVFSLIACSEFLSCCLLQEFKAILHFLKLSITPFKKSCEKYLISPSSSIVLLHSFSPPQLYSYLNSFYNFPLVTSPETYEINKGRWSEHPVYKTSTFTFLNLFIQCAWPLPYPTFLLVKVPSLWQLLQVNLEPFHPISYSSSLSKTCLNHTI